MKLKFSRIYVLLPLIFLFLTIFSMPGLLFGDEEEDIANLKKRVIELEMKEIENRVIIKDLKDLIEKLSAQITELKLKVDSQQDVIATVPRRVPRKNPNLVVEDTTPQEIQIEDINAQKPPSDLTGQPGRKNNPSGSNNQQPEPTDTASTPPVSITPANGPKKELYNTALRFYNTNAYDQSLVKFKEFIDNYPDDDLTDNAQYWIGECHLKKNQPLKAIEEFSRVIEYYPLGNKVPAAYLKIGYAYLSLDDKINALQNFHNVKDMFPHTDEANEADKKIKELSIR